MLTTGSDLAACGRKRPQYQVLPLPATKVWLRRLFLYWLIDPSACRLRRYHERILHLPRTINSMSKCFSTTLQQYKNDSSIHRYVCHCYALLHLKNIDRYSAVMYLSIFCERFESKYSILLMFFSLFRESSRPSVLFNVSKLFKILIFSL